MSSLGNRIGSRLVPGNGRTSMDLAKTQFPSFRRRERPNYRFRRIFPSFAGTVGC